MKRLLLVLMSIILIAFCGCSMLSGMEDYPKSINKGDKAEQF